MYNTVSVTLMDHEFKDITSKEVEVARYLDAVYDITLNYDAWLEKDSLEVSQVMLPQIKHIALIE